MVGLFSVFPHTLNNYPLAILIALCQYVVMVCVYCEHKTRVVNSREQKRLRQVWRRRTCKHCNALFTTLEAADLSDSHVVYDKKGKPQKFSRDTLFMSIVSSLGHRTTAIADANALCGTIIAKLLQDSASGTLQRSQIISCTHAVLQNFDSVAATYYSAYYK